MFEYLDVNYYNVIKIVIFYKYSKNFIKQFMYYYKLKILKN